MKKYFLIIPEFYAFLPEVYKSFHFFRSLSTVNVCYNQPSGCEVVSHGFDLHFPNEVRHIFTCALRHFISFLEKYQIICTFLLGLSFHYWVIKILYSILYKSHWSDILFENIFSHPCVIFSLPWWCLLKCKRFPFLLSLTYIFFFYSVCFWC